MSEHGGHGGGGHSAGGHGGGGGGGMSVIRELLCKIGFDADSQPLKDMDAGIASIKAGLFGLTSSIGAASAAIAGIVHTTAETGKAAVGMAARLGMSAEKVQELNFAAGLAGKSSDDVAMSVQRLARNLYEAQMGAPDAIKHFTDLGISFDQVKGFGNDAGKAFDAVAERFRTMPDGIKKTALAMQLMGRGGTNMLPVFAQDLKEAAEEAHDFGYVLDKEAIANSVEYMHTLHKLEFFIIGLKNSLGAGLLPAFTKVAQAKLEWLKTNKEFIKSSLAQFVQSLGDKIIRTANIISVFANSFRRLSQLVGGIGPLFNYLFVALAALSGLSIIFGIGKLVQAIYGIGSAFLFSGNAALLANLKMIAVPLLIGAALAALFVLLDDLVGWWRGDNSLFSLMYNDWNGFLDSMEARYPKLKSLFEDMRFAGENIKAAWAWLEDSALFKLASNGVRWMTGARPDYSGDPEMQQMMAGYAQEHQNRVQGSAFLSQYLPGVGVPSSLPPMLQGMGPVQVQAPVSVIVPPGTDPASVGQYVERGIKGGVESGLDRALRATGGSPTY